MFSQILPRNNTFTSEYLKTFVLLDMVQKNNYLTFGDAQKISAPKAFSSFIKPIGSACNLNCSYCYYLDKASSIYRDHQLVMSLELLEEYTKQYIEANEVPQVTFVWHGGEPLLVGLEYYKKALGFQQKYAKGKTIINTVQTNGTLLNADWCRFFNDNNFLIGISIDGPRDIHDAFRVNQAGSPTFDKVISGISKLVQFRVEYNTLSVISRISEGRGAEVYHFLKSVGSRFMQFLPVVEHVLPSNDANRPLIVRPGTPSSVTAPWSVSALGFGRFMTDIFDRWVSSDVGEYYVQMFDNALAQWVGIKPGMCIYSETCGDALIVEHNGDVYSCDHFVYPEFKLGNLLEEELAELYISQKQFDFGLRKRNNLPRQCLGCKYYFACRGECPKHRFLKTDKGEDNLNALCEGFKYFYCHVEPYMLQMKMLLQQNKPPSLIMDWVRFND